MAGDNSDGLPYNLVGFVTDPVSKQVIMTLVKDLNIGYTEVINGATDEAVEFLKKNRSPKIVILDISNSELPMSDIVKVRELGAPSMNIIAIGSKNDVGLFRDFLSIGISDYLVKPINTVLLKKAIDDANSGHKLEFKWKVGKLIYFLSTVGGAGSTTASVNIAWIMSNRHFRQTLMMDMNSLFGTVHLMLDMGAESSYLDLLESPDKIDEYFVETILKKYDNRLFYLGGLEDLMSDSEPNIEAFSTLLDLTKKQFNYIVVDAPRDVSGVARIAIQKADIVVLVVEMSVASAQNTARILEFLNADRVRKNHRNCRDYWA
ncbi:hypothetical protein FACS1894122_10160 [Alphaproteobacteria bacterium]|nr:hypothetical protein FACS1894122_10160 [Alphaproteobacteria bacterium]